MKRISFLLIIISIAYNISAQEVIDLRKAITIAIDKNTTISQIYNNIEIQKTNVKIQRGNLYPSLNFSGGWTRNNTYTSSGTYYQNGIPIVIGSQSTTRDNFSLGLSSSVTLFNGFSNYQSIDLENQNLSSLNIALDKTKYDGDLQPLYNAILEHIIQIFAMFNASGIFACNVFYYVVEGHIQFF